MPSSIILKTVFGTQTAARPEQRRSMSGCSAFTYWVRFNIPLTLRQALKKQPFYRYTAFLTSTSYT